MFLRFASDLTVLLQAAPGRGLGSQYTVIVVAAVIAALALLWQRNKEAREARHEREMEAMRIRQRDEEARRKQEAEELARRQAHEQTRKAAESYALTLFSQLQTAYLSLLDLVPYAGLHLSHAEQDFADHAYAPFWDRIKAATDNLAAYSELLLTIKSRATQYNEVVREYSLQARPIEEAYGSIPSPGSVVTRLEALRRQGQRDFQFAVIYEQRATTEVLVRGFGSLGRTIDGLSSKITSSLNDLSRSLDGRLEVLTDELINSTYAAQVIANEHQTTLEAIEQRTINDRRSFETILWEKLDEQNAYLKGRRG